MYLIYSFTYISMDCGIIWLKSSLLWLFHLSSCVPLTCSCRFGFRVLPYFLTFLDAPGSCIFPAPALEWAISPKNLGSFYWEMVFRNQDLDSGSAHCYWSVIASRPSHVTELGNMCVYIYINGNPLQCSCLENPRDGGAWWVAVYGVAQSRTQLKRLSSSSIYINPC